MTAYDRRGFPVANVKRAAPEADGWRWAARGISGVRRQRIEAVNVAQAVLVRAGVKHEWRT